MKTVEQKFLTHKINLAKLNSVGRGSQHYTLQLNILFLLIV